MTEDIVAVIAGKTAADKNPLRVWQAWQAARAWRRQVD